MNNDKIETTGVKESFELTVSMDDGIVAKMMRDNIYSNKVAAVCREVGSNSYDANVESGKANTPITIAIEKKSSILSKDLSISFHDNGPGMNRERMKIYSQYSKSTKRNSNNQIGGYGIGAKTPLAYGNSYIIETVAEEAGVNTKFIYMVVLGGDGSSETTMINLIDESPSDEPTGTKIIVPIKEEDRQQFEYETHYMSHLWEVQPNLVGFITQRPKKEVIYSGDGFKVYLKNSILRDNHMCSVSGILYPINTHEVRGFKRVDGSYCVIFEFKTGEIKLNGGRELLDYSSSKEYNGVVHVGTKERIEKRYAEFKEQMTTEVHAYYNGATNYAQTLLRAMQLNLYNSFEQDSPSKTDLKMEFRYFLSQFNRHILNFKPETYGNKKLYYDNDFRHLKIELISPDGFNPTEYASSNIHRMSPILLSLPIYEIKPGIRKNVKKILNILAQNQKAILIHHPKKFDSLSEREKRDYQEEVDLIKNLEVVLNNFHDVKPIKINLGKSTGKNTVIEIPVREITAYKGNNYHQAKSTVKLKFNKETIEFVEDEVVQAKSLIVIPVADYNWEAECVFNSLNVKLNFITQALITLKRQGEIKVLFVTEKKMHYFEELDNVIELDDAVSMFLKDNEVKKHIEDSLRITSICNSNVHNENLKKVKRVSEELGIIADGLIKEIEQGNKIDYRTRNVFIKITQLKGNENLFVLDETVKKNVQTIKSFIEKYPIIEYMSSYDDGRNLKTKQIIKAIKLLIESEK